MNYPGFNKPTSHYSLENLPYAYDALEPYIDARTMEIHHTKHHQAYIDNLNKALEQQASLQKLSLVDLLQQLDSVPAEVRTTVRNNGGGTFNHALFWTMMKKNGGGLPQGHIGTAIAQKFGSFQTFQEQFNTTAKTVFGSGWAWLVINKKGDLEIVARPNQDNPISEGMAPLMGIDVWEHAYYLKYQNRRVDYIQAWWHVINWDQIEQNYTSVK